ncbi:MAG: fused DSP-PTPase phosphatase/NAD kinase-like protein [Rickettsiales bacterium]
MKRIKSRTILISILGLVAFYAGVTAWMNNFHSVIPGELYRSGQFSSGDISYYTKRYGLRSVINLRGDNSGAEWYDRELKESNEAGVKHINFRMSAKRKLTREESLMLIETMRNAPKPVLIHCNGGANRTSLAAALYLAAITRADERTAQAQLSMRFGNFPTWLGSKSRMSETFEELEHVLGYDDEL